MAVVERVEGGVVMELLAQTLVRLERAERELTDLRGRLEGTLVVRGLTVVDSMGNPRICCEIREEEAAALVRIYGLYEGQPFGTLELAAGTDDGNVSILMAANLDHGPSIHLNAHAEEATVDVDDVTRRGAGVHLKGGARAGVIEVCGDNDNAHITAVAGCDESELTVTASRGGRTSTVVTCASGDEPEPVAYVVAYSPAGDDSEQVHGQLGTGSLYGER